MDEELKILLTADLDEKKSVNQINSAIKNIQKQIIKLKLEIDTTELSNAGVILKEMEQREGAVNRQVQERIKSRNREAEIVKRQLQEQMKAGKFSSMNIVENSDGSVKKITTTYKDELGRAVKEAFGWIQTEDGTKVFQRVGRNIESNVAKGEKTINDLLVQLENKKNELVSKQKISDPADLDRIVNEYESMIDMVKEYTDKSKTMSQADLEAARKMRDALEQEKQYTIGLQKEKERLRKIDTANRKQLETMSQNINNQHDDLVSGKSGVKQGELLDELIGKNRLLDAEIKKQLSDSRNLDSSKVESLKKQQNEMGKSIDLVKQIQKAEKVADEEKRKSLNELYNLKKKIEEQEYNLISEYGKDNKGANYDSQLDQLNRMRAEVNKLSQDTSKASALKIQGLNEELTLIKRDTQEINKKHKVETQNQKDLRAEIEKTAESRAKLIAGKAGVHNESDVASLIQDYDKALARMKEFSNDISKYSEKEIAEVKELTQALKEKLKVAQDAQAEVNRLNRLGYKQVGTTPANFDYMSDSAVKRYVSNNFNEGGNLPKMENISVNSRQISETGKAVVKLTADIETGKNTFTRYKIAIDEASGTMRLFGENIRQTANRNLDFAEQFKIATRSIAMWASGTQLIYSSLNKIREGVTFVNELNKSLTELSIVYMKSQKEVAEYGKTFHDLGMQMSVSTEEIAKGAVEFARQGLSESETMERMKQTAVYAKVSSLDFKQAAELVTASANSMQVSVERVSDVFTYMGKYCPLAS